MRDDRGLAFSTPSTTYPQGNSLWLPRSGFTNSHENWASPTKKRSTCASGWGSGSRATRLPSRMRRPTAPGVRPNVKASNATFSPKKRSRARRRPRRAPTRPPRPRPTLHPRPHRPHRPHRPRSQARQQVRRPQPRVPPQVLPHREQGPGHRPPHPRPSLQSSPGLLRLRPTASCPRHVLPLTVRHAPRDPPTRPAQAPLLPPLRPAAQQPPLLHPRRSVRVSRLLWRHLHRLRRQWPPLSLRPLDRPRRRRQPALRQPPQRLHL